MSNRKYTRYTATHLTEKQHQNLLDLSNLTGDEKSTLIRRALDTLFKKHGLSTQEEK
ncbi:ribbon-helix-helix domain-containing protein [Streptomyces xanthophaeus]|uniref:ribbon-helix-helix domain-containing protein n=1 Tax=Streptomyces xanthophaeus TaxID=67385 RepID=UPI00386DB955